MTGNIHHQQTAVTQHVKRLSNGFFRAVPVKRLQVNTFPPTLLETDADLEVLASRTYQLCLRDKDSLSFLHLSQSVGVVTSEGRVASAEKMVPSGLIIMKRGIPDIPHALENAASTSPCMMNCCHWGLSFANLFLTSHFFFLPLR